MFEIGKDYWITRKSTIGGEWTESKGVWKVEAVEGTLLKLKSPHSGDLILNTASDHFISAEPTKF